MAISDAQYLAWLAADNKYRAVLVEADYYGGTEYFSNFEYVTGPSATPSNTAHEGLLQTIPEIRSAIDQSASLGALHVLNMGGDLDSWLERAWTGWPIRMYLGDPAWQRSDFRAIFTGIIDELAAPSHEVLGFHVRDQAAILDRPINPTLYEGATHPAKGQGKPRCFGTVFNISPVLIDATAHRYQVHDGAVTAITAVRVGGIAQSYTANLANGTFTLPADSGGGVTCDVVAPNATASAMIQALLAADPTAQVVEINAASFAAFPTTTMGLYITDSAARRVDEALSEITASLGGFWRFDRLGELYLHQLALPTGTADISLISDDIREHGLRLAALESPNWRIRLGYRRNWTIQGETVVERPASRFKEPVRPMTGGDWWFRMVRERGRKYAEQRYRRALELWLKQQAELKAAVPEASRSEYADEYKTAEAKDETVKTQWPLADDPDLAGSLIVAEANAQSEAARRLAIRSTERRVFQADCSTAPFMVEVGDIAQLIHPRYGFAAGVNALVIGISEQPTRGRVILDLWR